MDSPADRLQPLNQPLRDAGWLRIPTLARLGRGLLRLAGPVLAVLLGLTATLGQAATASPVPAQTVPAQTVPAANPPVAEVEPQSPPYFDYSANLKSEVFGAHLFTGAFAHKGATQFNPDYAVAIGDQLQVRLWGAFEAEALFTVDPQGNIFLPKVGPVKVLGVRNKDLHAAVEAAVRRVFRANVYSYASLAGAQPVRIFVTGFVHRPGLYHGTSMDSLLHYLDQSGGIDPQRGSFLNLQVKRGHDVRSTVNLYDFLLNGTMPMIQLADGDTVLVQARQNTVLVSGLAENAKRFEFREGARHTVADLIALAKPLAMATHVRVVRNSGTIKNTEYYPLDNAAGITLQNGDAIEFTADKKPGTITVRVEGEHQSPQEYVLPYGSRLGDLMKNIQYSEHSDAPHMQLFRLTVRERQKQMLATALKSLESSVLTARSDTSEESRLRKDEAELILQWVERAKKIEPSGQVMIAQSAQKDSLLLENGDVVRIPVRDGLVLVSGEVLFPNAVAHDPKLTLDDYIRRAGGYAQSADTSRVIIAHRDGGYEEAEGERRFWNSSETIQIVAGDEILVLPKIQTKSIEVTRGISQIIYQIAIAAKVILNL